MSAWRHHRARVRQDDDLAAKVSVADISAKDLLHAVAHLCQPVPGEGVAYSQRMVALLVDGLRYVPLGTSEVGRLAQQH